MRDRQRIVFEITGFQIWEDRATRDLELGGIMPPRNIDQRVFAWRIATIRETVTCGLGKTNNVLQQYADDSEQRAAEYRNVSQTQKLREIESRVATLKQHIRSGAFGTVIPLDAEP